ncbi:acyl-CoA/acyl-ACP dehydrogenase [Amycolatopsis sp. K13G38]|uniref:Acyl-CoA/acyl-ACP dehydrogenase n=1 Tax=Amycolatopsis acididurans TaxID=2724524 RepID=A0ABX1JGP9_9PSEU|nr:acyl-CoA dehydrogenase family protein [Amycolatopsis acididurans]NKQ58977.1 acyl-CoA/acyl-ACP dehydrogenase [Amycolatopsis acididurans]
MTDLLYSDVEEDLRASVRDLFADKADAASLLARIESEEPYDLKLWRTVAGELGLAGLHVPEELGGQGASTRELAVVAEELGRSLAPVPFFGSAVLATSALLGCDTSADAVSGLLRRLATGETIGALAVPLATWPGSAFPTAVSATDGVLNGQIGLVADASVADVLVVAAQTPEGPALYAVDDFTTAEATSLDLTRRLADVTISGASGTLLASGEQAAAALNHALTVGAGLLASEQLGVAQWCLDETVAYVKQRYQFGRPVGSFQALKHRLADLYLELVTARASARYAADMLAGGDDDVPVAVALAQSTCGGVAVHAAEEAIQLHGGIGMTWEHPAHLYLKRAKSDEIALGTPGRHRAALAGLVNLPPA